jgi:hypothetical protein
MKYGFFQARQGWHICSIGNHLFFQAPFRSDLIGWRFAGAIRFGVGKRRLKTARRDNAGENAAWSKVPPGRLNGFHGNRFLSQGISAVPLGLIPFRRQPGVETPGYFRAVPRGTK